MKRIAYLGIKGIPAQAGVDRVVEALVLGINKQKFQPVVYCSNRVVPRDLVLPGIELVLIATLPGKHLHAFSLFILAALHILLFGKYDLVHVHNVEATFVVPLLKLRYKVIATSHGTAHKLDKWGILAKLLIRLTEYPYIYLSNCVTSVSQPLAAWYQQRYKRCVHYLPNGVNVENPIDIEAATALLQAHGVTPGNYILFVAGRMLAIKGCHYLLSAFQTIESDLKLVVVGDMSHSAEYEQQLRALADQRVCFIPFIEARATLFGLVKCARLYVFPSTVEAMSMMLLEVASIGAPMLCSDIPANRSVLPEGTLFFQSGNVADLRAQLCWALDHPAQMAEGAHKVENWVKQQFVWSKIVEEYESLYNTLLVERAVMPYGAHLT
jgi:glycosyltransferase involved in cell wall biosynthesis